MNTSDLNGQWLDFYALLGTAPDADKEVLRRAIGTTYAEASANADHRDLSRRHYFQTLVERVLPQARRVLLDPAMREAYDTQNALHQSNDSNALDYVSFMAALQSGVNPGAVAKAAVSAGEFDSLPERVRDEITLARAVLECVQSGSEFDLLPTKSLSGASPTGASPTGASPTGASPTGASPTGASPTGASPTGASTPTGADTSSAVSNINPVTEALEKARAEENAEAPIAPSETSANSVARLRQRPAAPSPDSTYFMQPAEGEATEKPAERARPFRPSQSPIQKTAPSVEEDFPGGEVETGREIRAKVIPAPPPKPQGPTIAERRAAAAAAAIANADNEKIGGHARLDDKPAPYKSRVVIGDDEDAPREKPKPQRRIFSPLSTHILTAITSALLIFTIIHFSQNSAPPVARTPLNIVYSTELRPVMEQAEAQFEASSDGAGVDVVLQPMDSRAAMLRISDAGKNAPDVWIPSESLWSNRYNQIASGAKRPLISVATPLALSPLVLVARSDQAAALRQQFKNRTIDNWNTLRGLVATNCAGHFGMTDPKLAGSGSLARFVMARQWCEKNRVAWNAAAANNPRLWQWMQGFENNVPVYKSSGDMAKDLALGTTGQYWWCLAYESDAIYWIAQQKQLEIFYLPGTYYADHPFCQIERPGAPRSGQAARVGFEKFLRSPAMQKALLQSGFRPPEIDLAIPSADNPFQTKGYADRGVRVSGFQAGGRLDYRTVNALTSQWAKRYSS